MDFEQKKIDVNADNNKLSDASSLVVRSNVMPKLGDIYRDALSGDRIDNLDRCLEVLNTFDFASLSVEELNLIKARLDDLVHKTYSFDGFSKANVLQIVLGTLGLGLSIFNQGFIIANLLCMMANFYALLRGPGKKYLDFKKNEDLRDFFVEETEKYYKAIDKNIELKMAKKKNDVSLKNKEDIDPKEKMVNTLSELQNKLMRLSKEKEVGHLEKIAGALNNYKMGVLDINSLIIVLEEVDKEVEDELDVQNKSAFKESFEEMINEYMDNISDVQDKVMSLKNLMKKLIDILDKNDIEKNQVIANGFAMCLWQTINCSSGREIIDLVDCMDERFSESVIELGESFLDEVANNEMVLEFKQELLAKKDSLNGGTYLIELITILKSFGQSKDEMIRGR